MKRFEDVLRMVSSVLLGSLVRDFDDLSNNLSDLFATSKTHLAAGPIARVTTIVLICVFLRNIHGSVRYDDMLAKMKSAPALARAYGGRVAEFCLALAALFFGPSLVGHYIAHHSVVRSAASPPVITPLLSGETFGWILFFPFTMYLAWDLLVWFLGDEDSAECIDVERVSYNWVLMDCVALALVLALGGLELYRRGMGIAFNYEFLAIGFVLVASVIVLGDYFLNRAFYFPSSAAD